MVYQRQNLSNGKTVWMFVQPFQTFKNFLWKHVSILQTPIEVHALLLSASLAGWRPYLEYLRRTLSEYVGASCSRLIKSLLMSS